MVTLESIYTVKTDSPALNKYHFNKKTWIKSEDRCTEWFMAFEASDDTFLIDQILEKAANPIYDTHKSISIPINRSIRTCPDYPDDFAGVSVGVRISRDKQKRQASPNMNSAQLKGHTIFKCPFTFGVESKKGFDPDKHTASFDIFVERGERINVGQTIQRVYFPDEKGQTLVEIPVYRSIERCHQFSNNCEKIACVTVDVPNSTDKQKIKVKVTLEFQRRGMHIVAVNDYYNMRKTAYVKYHRNATQQDISEDQYGQTD